MKAIKNFMTKITNAKNRLYAMMTMAMISAYCAPAYGAMAVSQEGIESTLSSVIDIVFNIFSVGIGVVGLFQLIPSIMHFIQASNSQNGEQRKEAGSGIGTSVMILLLAGLVFMLKAPVKTMVGLSS
jgi:ABC-type phosphate transport system permease subunit